MKINYIKLVDCIGIHKGLGLSEIEIDLSVFKSGLIGVFGKSGSGKSTLLRNLSPYRTDFKNDFYEDGYREIKFEFAGSQYISQVYQSQAFLFKNGVLLNETGKVSIYDQALEEELGSEGIFLKMLYAGRRFKNIFDLTKSERKQLVMDFLLDHLSKYEDYEKKFKDELFDCKLEYSELQYKIKDEEQIKQKITETKKLGKQRTAELMSHQEELTHFTDLQEKFKVQETKNIELNEKLKYIRQQIKSIDLDSLFDSIQEKEKKKKIVIEKHRAGQLICQQETELTLDQIKQKREKISKLYEEQNKQEKKLIELKSEKNQLIKSLKSIQTEYDELEKSFPPCTEDLQIQCPLTKNLNYSSMLKEKRKRLDKINDEIKEVETKINDTALDETDYQTELRKLSGKESDLLKIEKEKELNSEREKIIAELDTDLKKARQQYTEQETVLADLENQKNSITGAITTEYTDCNGIIAKINKNIVNARSDIELYKKQIISWKQNLETIQEYKQELSDLQGKIEQYPILIEMFGKNGLSLFDIETTGEQISLIANKLLENYYGQIIQIRFETLKLNSKNELKEVFDVSCSINDGDWQTYLSDGQSVLVSNAIREAMSFLRKNSNYKTVFIDELDGSIDSENRIGFLKLLEEGNKLTNRDRTFLISHSEEIKTHIQQIIEFNNNQINLIY